MLQLKGLDLLDLKVKLMESTALLPIPVLLAKSLRRGMMMLVDSQTAIVWES